MTDINTKDEKNENVNNIESLFNIYKEQLGIKEINPANYSPLVLAYLGDAVYEVIIRLMIVSKGNMQVNKMHNESKKYVNAKAQAKVFYNIKPLLTDEEASAFRRGRNAKSNTVPKNANVSDYRTATGFEALIGYLTMKKSYLRIMELIAKGVE